MYPSTWSGFRPCPRQLGVQEGAGAAAGLAVRDPDAGARQVADVVDAARVAGRQHQPLLPDRERHQPDVRPEQALRERDVVDAAGRVEEVGSGEMGLAPTDRFERLEAVAALPDQLDGRVPAPQVLGQQAGGRIAADRDQRGLQAGRVGEQLDASGATVVPARRTMPLARGSVSTTPAGAGQRPGDQPPADVRHLDAHGLLSWAVARVQQLGADGRQLVHQAEQVVHAAAEHPRQPQRDGHRRGGLAGLDGADGLAGDAGAVGELGLGDPKLRSRGPQQDVERAVIRHAAPSKAVNSDNEECTARLTLWQWQASSQGHHDGSSTGPRPGGARARDCQDAGGRR